MKRSNIRKGVPEGPFDTFSYSRTGGNGFWNYPDMDRNLSELQFPHWYNEVIVKFLLNRIVVKIK